MAALVSSRMKRIRSGRMRRVSGTSTNPSVEGSAEPRGSGEGSSASVASPCPPPPSPAEKYWKSGFVRCDPKLPLNEKDKCKVDIIAVCAVGGDPEQTWQPIPALQPSTHKLNPNDLDALPATGPLWITQGLRDAGGDMLRKGLRDVIKYARVLIYNHGKPDSKDDLDSLATRLLDHIRRDRTPDKKSRPIFFICHSTGGLVVKAALIQTQNKKEYTSIKYHSYGITFFATPHQGSSYLSSPAFNDSISKAMRLVYAIPPPLQLQLEVNSEKLIEMSLNFNRVAAELKIWSFYETVDTKLTPKSRERDVFVFTAPIVSIKSAVLELHHEVERPLEGNHADCAAFGSDNNYAQWSFLEKLQKAVEKSLELCNKEHIELDLKKEVEVEIHGFYEAGDRPTNLRSKRNPIRLWSTKSILSAFIEKGPAECLQEFLQQNTHTRDSGQLDSSRPLDSPRPMESPRDDSPNGKLTLSPNPIIEEDPFRRVPSEGNLRRPSGTTLTRPTLKNQKLTWVHLPFNNPTWCSDILKCIAKEKDCDLDRIILDPKNWQKKHIWGRHTQYHACFMKPGCNLLIPDLEPEANDEETREELVASDIQMTLYFPYLHWDTYKRMIRRRNIIKERIAQGRSRPTPNKIGKLDLEHKVSWRYLSYDPPFNTRRTLDQFGYPNLLDTRARDDDQMLYKMTKAQEYKEEIGRQKGKNTRSEFVKDVEGKDEPDEDDYERLKDGKVLMVDQVWLWLVDNSTTVTFFPQREPIHIEGRLYQQADLRNSIYNEVNGDLSRRCENSLDLSALVALHAVTLLFERASHRDLEVFRIFEESISILVEKMTISFKYFREKGFRATADSSPDSLHEDAHTMKKRHKHEGQLFQEQIQDNVSAVLELRDIGDELGTLRRLFEGQQESLGHMLEFYERTGNERTNGCSFLLEAQAKLRDYLHQIMQMMETVDRTKNDFEKLLDLVQKQANVDEARLSRWQADVQGVQSRAVMIFTVFNIIFLPLTFFTGLFGMNIREWSNTGSNIDATTAASIALPISASITVCALGFALSTRVRSLFGTAMKLILNPFEDPDRQDPIPGIPAPGSRSPTFYSSPSSSSPKTQQSNSPWISRIFNASSTLSKPPSKLDSNSSSDPNSETSSFTTTEDTTTKEAQKPKHRKSLWAWRLEQKDRKKEDYDARDFWNEHRSKENSEYNIPKQNKWPVTVVEKAGKVGKKDEMSRIGTFGRRREGV